MDSSTLKKSVINIQPDPKKEQFPLKVKPNTVLCLVQDCGKIFKRRMDMMKHNIVHLLQKPNYTDGLDKNKVASISSKKVAPMMSMEVEQPEKKDYCCSVAECGEVCESFEGLKQHLMSAHCELKELLEPTECCSSSSQHDHEHMESSSSDMGVGCYDENEENDDEVERMIKLAIVENHLLKERLYKAQQAALMYQQQLAQSQAPNFQ